MSADHEPLPSLDDPTRDHHVRPAQSAPAPSAATQSAGPLPRAAMRLQLHAGFGFDDAAAVVPLLARMGFSHVYTSPVLQATKGSMHGYDVVDHSRVSDDLGGEAARRRFVAALRAHSMGWLLDIVPNHMAIDVRANRWWWDVLENGPSSPYASFFDIDWDPPEPRLRGVVLAPILGDHRGRCLERREIRVERDAGGAFVVRYFDHALPLAPRSYDVILRAAAVDLDGEARDTMELLADAHGELPRATAIERASVRRRHRDKNVLRRFLGRLLDEDKDAAAAVAAALAELNDDPDHLDELLERQNYRLAFWRTAERELDYRRFFDINNLVGLRTEDELVFTETHQQVLDWLARGDVDGLRIDHIDGLADPEGYLQRLRQRAPHAWIVVEKILGEDEELRSEWPVDGTTGYEALNAIGGLFVDGAAAKALADVEERFIGSRTRSFGELARDKKLNVLREALASDVKRLTSLAAQLCAARRETRDYTRHDLHEALVQVIASFPVYRTYVTGKARDEDRAVIEAALVDAAEHAPELGLELTRAEDGERGGGERADSIGSFLHEVLTGGIDGDVARELRTRFQQLTGPAMAKGVEDTAFYCTHRLASLCEVGGHPERVGVSVAQFHAQNARAQQRWPRRLVTTSTHDTKRSEDVRMRMALISEAPQEWAKLVDKLAKLAARHGPPDTCSELLLYQTLVGAASVGGSGELDGERLAQFALKAAREAKTQTSWTRANADYEAQLVSFARALASDDAIAGAVAAFVEPLLPAARVASVAQTLLKLTIPGVPDVYQGCELWDESLVDPDNRRPVDWVRRRALVDELERLAPQAAGDAADADAILGRLMVGLPKLHVIRQAAQLRARRPDAFSAGHDGRYTPLSATGPQAERVVAFARGDAVVVAVPRLVSALIAQTSPATFAREAFGDTKLALPQGTTGVWRNVLTGDDIDVDVDGGGVVSLARLWARFPVALLEQRRSAR